MSEGFDSDQIRQHHSGPPWDTQGHSGSALILYNSCNWTIKEKIRIFIFDPGGQADVHANYTMTIQKLLDTILNRMVALRTG
jgi:hypothetical protein